MKRLLSGITPSGDGSLHIGNYLGAVKQFISLAKTHECLFMFADFHALTTVHDKQTLQKNIEELILNELALIGDMPHVYFFRQSDIAVHTELTWIFNTLTPLGVLKRAHAYKDKLSKDASGDEINVGLFTYPVLMASDILLYKPDIVPVGKDQKQHVEIARDIAERFNRRYRAIFPLPEPYISEDTAVIPGTDGKRKMSKSLGNIIAIFEREDVIRKQVFSCFTDPSKRHVNDPGHIEGNMVFYYLRFFGEPDEVNRMEERYKEGRMGDIEAKEYLYQSIFRHFDAPRKRYETLKHRPDEVRRILERGTAKAREIANQTIEEVRHAIGLKTVYSTTKQSCDEYITIDDFLHVKQQVGKVIDANYPEKSDRLIRLTVDFGDEERVVFTAVRQYGYTKDDFVGKQFFFVVNLLPKKMMGEESNGMILAVEAEDNKPKFLSAEGFPLGAFIR